MLRRILVVIVFYTVLACKEATSKVSFSKENFTEHYIDYAKGSLLLPHKYDIVTREKLSYLISEKDSSSVLRSLTRNLDADRMDYILFVDENDLNDIILIIKSKFINFSKQDGNQYLGLLEQNIKSTYGLGNYKRLQKKISQTERAKYLKFKYKISNEGFDFYQTQYVVTSAATTFGVIEIRTESIDYEDLIKRINYLVN